MRMYRSCFLSVSIRVPTRTFQPERNLSALFSNNFFLCHAILLRVTGCGIRVIKKDYSLLTTRNTQLVTLNTYVIGKQTSKKDVLWISTNVVVGLMPLANDNGCIAFWSLGVSLL
jgi:hypothetical protein